MQSLPIIRQTMHDSPSRGADHCMRGASPLEWVEHRHHRPGPPPTTLQAKPAQMPPRFAPGFGCLPGGFVWPVPPVSDVTPILTTPLLALRKPSRPRRASQSSPARERTAALSLHIPLGTLLPWGGCSRFFWRSPLCLIAMPPHVPSAQVKVRCSARWACELGSAATSAAWTSVAPAVRGAPPPSQ